jgi:hypothetical protein
MLMRIAVSVVVLLCCSFASTAQTFTPQDKLLILVKGFPLSSSLFGYSGKATLFRSVGTNADGSLQFVPVPGAQDVDVERNSAKDFNNKANYGTNGFVPPGIYFLHYHRMDPSLGQIRHRLGMSDDPGGETIRSTIPNPPVTRTAIQFHKAFNDLASFSAAVSEGCITLKEDNFFKLFPLNLFVAAQSPLRPGSADSNASNLAGSSNSVLVFVTDALTAGKQDQQVAQFNDLRKKLKPADFSSANIAIYRVLWK